MKGIKTVVTVEQFAEMTADQIARYVRTNNNTAIVGDQPGKDRHIVEYENWGSLYAYLSKQSHEA